MEWMNKELFSAMPDADFFIGENGTMLWGNKNKGGTLILFRMMPSGVLLGKNPVPLQKCKVNQLEDSVVSDTDGVKGILRMKNEKLTFESFETIPDGAVLYPCSEILCKGGFLYGTNAAQDAIHRIIRGCLDAWRDYSAVLSVAVVNETANGIEDSLAMITRIQPDRVLICAPCPAEDSIELGKGACVCMKDGGCMINRNEYENLFLLEKHQQPFVGDTKCSLSRLYLAAKTRKMAAIYFPVDDLWGRIEKVSLFDVEKTQNLLLKYVEKFVII